MYGDCEILRYVMPTCLSAASAIIIKLSFRCNETVLQMVF